LRKLEQAKALEDVALLDEAIGHFRTVLARVAETAPMYLATLHNLAGALSDRFQRLRDPGDLDEAVPIMREVASDTADNSPYRARRCATLDQGEYATAMDRLTWCADLSSPGTGCIC
jgi:hypothetical protein